VQHRHRHGKDWHLYTYRWVNQIPLRNEQPAILVNWCELTITRASDDSQIYDNAWITDHRGARCCVSSSDGKPKVASCP